ncbi:unnamed protein product [Closterium sp. Naga37s-1]|nr:unnamed protein product [Closterium sp. Naga37s-1]
MVRETSSESFVTGIGEVLTGRGRSEVELEDDEVREEGTRFVTTGSGAVLSETDRGGDAGEGVGAEGRMESGGGGALASDVDGSTGGWVDTGNGSSSSSIASSTVSSVSGSFTSLGDGGVYSDSDCEEGDSPGDIGSFNAADYTASALSVEPPSTSSITSSSSVSSVDGGSSSDSEGEFVGGDMCASATGVVRVQSRKKAEMYLVRTDGISCTREKVTASTLAFSHPSTQQQMLMWRTRPRTVLLLKKLGTELMSEAMEVARFLQREEGMNVMVEPELHDTLSRMPGFGFLQTFYAQDTSKLHEKVDFVVCLGGDGVILHASNIFSSSVPPIVSFNLGSLGFLTAHPYEQYKQDLKAVIHGQEQTAGVYITLRMRLKCEVVKGGQAVPGKVFDVLNEVVVDRGSNPYLCKIECYERSKLITKVQADGVIVATPTGSTAYSTAAGGSMVHPNVPCMLFTPICPHSLSFRPIILPDSALLELRVPADARSNCWVSFDGKKRQQLSRGDSVRISMSAHPVPTVNKRDQTDDWFASLVRCLNWNERMEQKGFNTVF